MKIFEKFSFIRAHFFRLCRKKPGFAGLRAHALQPRRIATYGGRATAGGYAPWLLRTPPIPCALSTPGKPGVSLSPARRFPPNHTSRLIPAFIPAVK
jgi:hypothetical protein